MFAGSQIYKKHPDWVQRRIDGEPTSQHGCKGMCPNSPYREYLLKLIREISKNYPVDGFFIDELSLQSWCTCRYCQEKFRKDQGEDIPTQQNWSSPQFKKFISWRFDCISSFARDIYKTVKEIDNSLVCTHQYHFPLSITLSPDDQEYPTRIYQGRLPSEHIGWYRPTFYAQKLEDLIKYEDIVSTETYRRYVGQPLWWVGLCTKYLRDKSQGKPVLVLTEYPFLPWDLSSCSPAELKIGIADIVANGGCPEFAMYGPNIGDPRGWESVKEMYQMLKGLESYLVNLRSNACVAVLHSDNSATYYGGKNCQKEYLDEVIGMCKALVEEHIPFDLISEEKIDPRELKKYSTLCLPNSACLDEAKIKIIIDYVKNGGGLVASYKTSLFNHKGDMRSELALGEVLGVNYEGEEAQVGFGYMNIEKRNYITELFDNNILLPYLGSQISVLLKPNVEVLITALSSPGTFSPIMRKEKQLPALITNNFGEGKVVYFPGKIGTTYLTTSALDYRVLLSRSISYTLREDGPWEVLNCPAQVEVNSYVQEKEMRIIFFLVNFSCGMNDTPREIIPVSGIKIRTKILYENGKIFRVFSAVSSKRLDYEVRDGTMVIRIPRLDIFECIVVQFSRPF